MIFDPMYFVFMIPGVLLMLWAQSKVKGSYKRWSQTGNLAGLTGAQAARRVLDANGLHDVAIEHVPGADLSDHYDPRTRVLRLSDGVHSGRSVAALAIAAHEAGHALQHAQAWAPLRLRTAIVPAVNIGSTLGGLVLLAGVFLQQPSLAWIGVILFASATVFALVTLPVEFDASNRARAQLVRLGLVDGGVGGGEEGKGVKAMLDSAAWTYVASFAASLLTLLYYVSLVTGMNRSQE